MSDYDRLVISRSELDYTVQNNSTVFCESD